MKKLVVVFFTLVLAVTVMNGMTITAKGAKKGEKGGRSARIEMGSATVNTLSDETFKADIGNVPSVTWSHNSSFDLATYKKDNETKEAIFDFNGNLVGTSTVEKFSSLPKSAQERISKEYKNYSIGKVIHFNYLGDVAPDFVMSGNLYNYPDGYFVDLIKGTRVLVIEVSPDGEINLFSES